MKSRSLLIALASLLFCFSVKAQTEQIIQDTFLDMKFGNVYIPANVKNSVGQRGVFNEVSTSIYYKEVEFTDYSFGGYKWDFATFSFNKSNRFFEFEVSNHFTLRDDALELYKSMVDRLGNKYYSSYTEDEYNDKCVRYDGQNGVSVLVRLTYSLSKGGSRYYYVDVDYFHNQLYREVVNSIDSEL